MAYQWEDKFKDLAVVCMTGDVTLEIEKFRNIIADLFSLVEYLDGYRQAMDEHCESAKELDSLKHKKQAWTRENCILNKALELAAESYRVCVVDNTVPQSWIDQAEKAHVSAEDTHDHYCDGR